MNTTHTRHAHDIDPANTPLPIIDNARTRALIAEGRYRDAQRYARAAVTRLTRRDEHLLLVDTLILHAISLARLGNYSAARFQLNLAIKVAAAREDIEGESAAKLTIIQELSGQTSTDEMVALYTSALGLLQRSQDPSAIQRLIDSFATIVDVFQTVASSQVVPPARESWEGFSLKRELRRHEQEVIREALRDSGGSVTAAARRLGFNHHQSLISVINSRHRELLTARSAVRKRHHHLISSSKSKRKLKTKAASVGINSGSVIIDSANVE